MPITFCVRETELRDRVKMECVIGHKNHIWRNKKLQPGVGNVASAKWMRHYYYFWPLVSVYATSFADTDTSIEPIGIIPTDLFTHYSLIVEYLEWSGELRALQRHKTQANEQSTSRRRKFITGVKVVLFLVFFQSQHTACGCQNRQTSSLSKTAYFILMTLLYVSVRRSALWTEVCPLFDSSQEIKSSIKFSVWVKKGLKRHQLSVNVPCVSLATNIFSPAFIVMWLKHDDIFTRTAFPLF